MKKFLILISLLATFFGIAYVSVYTVDAKERTVMQKRLVCFTIVDEYGDPLPYVSVQVKGTTRGVTTDWDGGACIELEGGETLVISMIGYVTKEIVYSGQSLGTITLYEE